MPVLLPRRASPGTAEGAKASAAGDMATRVNAATFDADTILSNFRLCQALALSAEEF